MDHLIQTDVENIGVQTWPLLVHRAWQDILEGARRRETWFYLAWHEVQLQYRRSFLGPFWLTLNMGILVGALGWFYSGIFSQEIDHFLPYVGLGFMIFGLMSGIVNDSSIIYSAAAAGLKQSMLPMSFYAYKLIIKNLILFAHNLVIYLLLVLIFQIPVGFITLAAVPGILLILFTGFFFALILGPLAARFRDIPPIVSSITQIFFFMTPVFWVVGDSVRDSSFLTFNPFYHYLEIVRQPLLGVAPDPQHYAIATMISAVLTVFAVFYFSRIRTHIAFWV